MRKIMPEKIPGWTGEHLRKFCTSLRSYWQLITPVFKESVFFREVTLFPWKPLNIRKRIEDGEKRKGIEIYATLQVKKKKDM